MLSYFDFLAGIALMLYGIRTLRKGSDRLFGARLRRLIQSATSGRLRSLFAGILVSILTPSSTAVALLSMEAINAGYVTFQQVLALMLGANVGFTITVYLLAFKFYTVNTVFFAAGVPLFLFGRRPLTKGTGQLLLGIGFLLLSIQVLSGAVAPLKTSVEVKEIMQVLENHPIWIVFFTILLKQLLQSATATIGIALTLCAQQVLPLNAAVAVVIGANIGIAVTALIAGYARTETKRMAVGNLLFKLAGAAVCLPFLSGLVNALQALTPHSDPLVIANAYSIFNIVLAIFFLPILSPVARLVEKFVPARPATEKSFGPRYLDPASLESPALALGQATREVLHMADHVRTMLQGAHEAFKVADSALCKRVQQQDDEVDVLNNEIKAHLTKLSEQGLTTEESQREIAVLVFATELENIGDIIDKNLMELARKKITLHIEFSKNGWNEVEALFQKVDENLEIAASAFASWDRSLAEKLLRHKHYVNEWERDLRNRHFRRLHEGLIESIETSSIHLDVLTNLKRINSHLSAVAYLILNETKPDLAMAPAT
jgi:phosphate:Na+ symporter